MTVCAGTGTTHCCWVDGEVCRFLEEHTMPGRRWVCGLRRELGSWDAVHTDPGYLEHVRPVWERLGIADCGDWPVPGETCATCGVTGGPVDPTGGPVGDVRAVGVAGTEDRPGPRGSAG